MTDKALESVKLNLFDIRQLSGDMETVARFEPEIERQAKRIIADYEAAKVPEQPNIGNSIKCKADGSVEIVNDQPVELSISLRKDFEQHLFETDSLRLDKAEKLIIDCFIDFLNDRAPSQESAAMGALKKINAMIGNAIGAGTLRPLLMSESDSRFFWIFDVTKEALSKIEGGKS